MKYGERDVERPPRRADRDQIQPLEIVRAPRGRAAQREGAVLRYGRRLRRGIDRRCDRPGGFREVLVEGAFEEAGERTVDAHHRVPPVIRVLRVTEPLIADARSPRERHPAVHDEDLPVRAIVQFLERVPARLAEETHAHAGVTEPVGPLTRNPVGAHRVDDQVHLDAALRRTFQRRRELLADASPSDRCRSRN